MELMPLSLAIIGVTAMAYFDQFNKMEIPRDLVMAFFGISVFYGFFFAPALNLMVGGILLIFVTFAFPKFGVADKYVVSSLGLLLGLHAVIILALAFLSALHFVFLSGRTREGVKRAMRRNYPFVPHLLTGLILAAVMS